MRPDEATPDADPQSPAPPGRAGGTSRPERATSPERPDAPEPSAASEPPDRPTPHTPEYAGHRWRGRLRAVGREWWISLGAGVVAGLVAAAVSVGRPIVNAPDGCGGFDQLVIGTGTDLSLNRQRQRLLDLWNRLRPADDPEAVQEELPGVADEHRSQMMAVAQSGGCRYDLLNLDLPWIEEFYRAGLLRPIRGISGTGFLRPSWEAGVRRERGRVVPFAVPLNADVGLLYYRTDLLARLGLDPPKTWEDVDRIAERLADPANAGEGKRQSGQSGPGEQSGGAASPVPGQEPPDAAYAGQFAPYEGLTVNLLEVLRGTGTDLVRPDGTHVIDSPEARQALTDLAGRMIGERPVIWPGSVNSDESATLRAFTDGEVVLMRNWPYAFRVLAEDPDLVSGATPRFGVTQLPVRSAGQTPAGVLGGQSLAVARASRHPSAAERLIGFLTGPAAQRLMFSCGGYVPVREAAFEAVSCADTEKALGIPAEHRTGSGVEPGTPETARLRVLAAELRTALRNARPRPVTPYYGEFTTAVQQRIHPLLQQREPPGHTAYEALRDSVCDALSGPGGGGGPTGCE